MLKRHHLFLLIILFVGLAIRLDFLTNNHFAIDSDEAIVGLMAKHIAEGQAIPTFYYGQHYMGSLEAICVAALGSVVGFENYTLKLVPLAFYLIFLLLVYLFTKELSNYRAGLIAALYTAISPIAFVLWSTKARGGFIEVITIGLLAFYLLVRAVKQEKLGYLTLAMVSLLLGLGWWVNNQIIYFMIPVFIVVLINVLGNNSLLKTFKMFLWSIAAFVLGGLPFWILQL